MCKQWDKNHQQQERKKGYSYHEKQESEIKLCKIQVCVRYDQEETEDEQRERKQVADIVQKHAVFCSGIDEAGNSQRDHSCYQSEQIEKNNEVLHMFRRLCAHQRSTELKKALFGIVSRALNVTDILSYE
jgi:hypothetical protein